mmetsp:Transcript_57498/g.168859  ORF Transcript_57498/g.168859 Transcript_57498/m.168859 type:complete len:498 (-) Transcript_57498:646-2139(-)
MVFCAWCAAASQAAMARRASPEARASMPFRKGSSSSVQRCTARSAFSTNSTAEAMRSAVSSRSRCSFAVPITLSSFRSAAEHLDRMAESSSFRTPWAVLSFTSTSLAVVLSFVLHDAISLSRRSTLSADGASPPCGTTSAATLSTSPSVVRRRSTTSASICFTRRRSSASFVALRSLAMSCCMLFTRVCSRPSSLPELAPAIASFLSSAVRCRRCLRAFTMLACAARSARLACSTASCAPSATVSPGAPRWASACVASIIFRTSSSAPETLFSTSSRRWERFRSAVLARNCCSLARPSSMRLFSASTSSFTVLAGPSVKRATSTIFLATKVCASASAVWTFEAVWSASARSVSRSFPPWSPRRNGSSASAMTCSSSSALLTFSETSRRRLSAAIRTCVSFTVLRTSSSFSWACRARSRSALISSQSGLGDWPTLFSFDSMRRLVCDREDCAEPSATSASFMASGLSPPRGATIMAAFSTSTSAPESLLESSSWSCLA